MRQRYNILLTVSEEELRGLLNHKQDLVFRSTYPSRPDALKIATKFGNGFVTYLALRNSEGAVLGKCFCSMISMSFGNQRELSRANISIEEFKKKFRKIYKEKGKKEKQVYYTAIAWELKEVFPVNLHISEFLAPIDKQFTIYRPVPEIPNDWRYIVNMID